MKIWVSPCNKQPNIMINIDSNATITSLYNQVSTIKGLKAQEIQLVYKGSALKMSSQKTLQSFSIQQGSRLFLIIPIKGGNNINIYVQSLQSQPATMINIDSNATINDLYNLVLKMKEHKEQEMNLVYAGINLRRQYKTLQSFGIQQGSRLFCVLRLKGGMKQFGTVLFNSMEKSLAIKFNKLAPSWRVISAGLNLKGKCNYSQCDANKQIVWIPKGFGVFFINKQVQEAMCPKCKKKASEITNFGYYNCKIKVEGKVQGEEKKFTFDDHHQGNDDMKTFVQDDSKLLNWDYLIIEVSK